MSNEFSVAEYQPEDWNQVRDLFAAVYGKDSHKYPTQADWNWRYHNGLFKSTVWLARWHDSQVVAMRPTVTRVVKTGEGYSAATHFMDVMTHPDFRRRGLFTHLVRWATDVATEQGAAICYSFPNEASLPAYAKKTDWTYVGSLSLFIRPVSAKALLRERVKSPVLLNVLALLLQPGLALACKPNSRGRAEGASVQQMPSFDGRFDAFWEEAANDYEVIFRRDSRYLNWRYIRRPGVQYVIYAVEGGERILGFIVGRTWRMYGVNFGLIVDLLTLNQDQGVAQVLVAKIAHHLAGSGADAIGCVMFDHQPYCQALRREGFIRVPNRLLPRRFFFMARVNQDDPSLRKALDRRNWFLTLGDNDAV